MAEALNQEPAFADLAKQFFGNQYKGEPEAPVEAQEPVSEQVEAEPVVEQEAPVEAAVEAEEAVAEEVPQEPEESLAEIIRQNLDAAPDLYENVKVRVKVNGEDSEVSIDELRRSYQIQTAAEKRLEEAKVKAKAIQDEAAQKAEQINQSIAVAAKIIEKAESKLTDDISRANLAELRVKDPAEYAALIADFQNRRAEIEGMKREAVETFQNYQNTLTAEQEKQRQEALVTEYEALLNAIPEWKDESKALTEKTQLSEYLVKGLGFAAEDIQSAIDHRLFVMARKAMLYDQMQQKTNVAAKKVAQVPKVMKPGAPKPLEQVQQEQAQKLRDRVKRSGSIDDAFAFLKATKRI